MYWTTTNVWTIGQQLLVKKPTRSRSPQRRRATAGGRQPARGKPRAPSPSPRPPPLRRPSRPRATPETAHQRRRRRRRRRRARRRALRAPSLSPIEREPPPHVEPVAEAAGDTDRPARRSGRRSAARAALPGVTADCVDFEVVDEPGPGRAGSASGDRRARCVAATRRDDPGRADRACPGPSGPRCACARPARHRRHRRGLEEIRATVERGDRPSDCSIGEHRRHRSTPFSIWPCGRRFGRATSAGR